MSFAFRLKQKVFLCPTVTKKLKELFPKAAEIKDKIWFDVESDAVYSWFDVMVYPEDYDWDNVENGVITVYSKW